MWMTRSAGATHMGLTFNEKNQCWHFRSDFVVKGVRRRANALLP